MESIKLVEIAYKKFKQYAYYEQLDLFQRKKIADFECDSNFDKKLNQLSIIIDIIKKGADDIEEIDNLLKNINYNLIPKSIGSIPCDKKSISKDKDDKNFHFITNNKSSDKYCLEGINYFIDVPIELQLICVIWIMKAGVHIDSGLSDSCYWFRLNEKLKKPNEQSSHIFKLYNTQYSEWRKNAIQKAEDTLKKENKDIAILSLDLKHCFYCIHPDFSKLREKLNEIIDNEEDRIFAASLTKILEKIHAAYQEKIEKGHFCYTHGHIKIEPGKYSVPIGLVSSGIICNWHLSRFDDQIIKELNPAYYGRYADDILIVISNPDIKDLHRNKKQIIEEFLKKYFEKLEIFKPKEENGKILYCLNVDPNLCIQPEKLLLHFYSADHSLAMLEIFKQKIKENSSAFYLLPEKELEFYINNTAYSLLFEGSTNKFRSIMGIAENVTELSIKLSKINQILNQNKVKNETLEAISDQIFKFYKGSNFINFCRTWEKYFTFSVITSQYTGCANFYFRIQDTIKKISEFKPENPQSYDLSKSNELLERQKADLQKYLDISLSMPVSLLGSSIGTYFTHHTEEGKKNYKTTEVLDNEIINIGSISYLLRKSNLIRHLNIRYPLINYTEYDDSLIDWEKIEEYLSKTEFIFNKESKKIKFSPRFIHFDEFYLFWFMQKIHEKTLFEITDIISNYVDLSNIDKTQFPITIDKMQCMPDWPENKVECDDKKPKVSAYHIHIPKKISSIKTDNKTLKIGVANIKIKEKYLESSYKPRKKPDLSIERQIELFQIMNSAKNEKCDLLILPELSVPHRWLPFMVNYARNHQIGLIFGMEYWINQQNKNAYNYIVAALPIINEDKYKTCCPIIRCKNHYSPREKNELIRAHLVVPKVDPYRYDLIKWRNSQFSIYNCYELADITHRSLFKSDLDFLVACVLNRDISYFSSIIESVVKDLHCYVIQVNCSEYGDSRVVQPTSREKMNLIRVTGGENSTILTADLDLDKLRDYQSLGYSETDKRFKPTPPGFDHSKPRKR
jgi:hypothetical protein